MSEIGTIFASAAVVVSVAACTENQRAPSDDTQAALLSWSGVSEHRGTVAGGSDMFLLTIRPDAPAPVAPTPSANRPCLRAQAFLPGPAHDARVFLLVDGSLRAYDPRKSTPGAVQSLAGLKAGHTITNFLAVGKDQRKVELLVLMGERDKTGTQPWLLTIDNDRIAAAAATGDAPAYRDKDAFFARFHVPRCKHGDRRCVAAVPTSGSASLIVEEPRRGAPSQPVVGFERLSEAALDQVKDVAWVAGDDDALYLAFACRAGAP